MLSLDQYLGKRIEKAPLHPAHNLASKPQPIQLFFVLPCSPEIIFLTCSPGL